MRFLYLITIIFSINLRAKSITDYSPYKYEVFFTNPECELYEYELPVFSNDGEVILARPKNVYCTKSDIEKNLQRKDSPNYNIRKLISNPEVKELFLSFLSFSDEAVSNELCKAIEQRNVKVTFIIDSTNNLERRQKKSMAQFNKVSKCRAKFVNDNEQNIPRMELRGNTSGLGFAHNKLIIAHFEDSNKVTLVFGSANMSTGTLTHHENWNFLTTSKKTHFYQVHECVRNGMLDHGQSIESFTGYFKKCRSKIEVPKEDDIELFIVPSDGKTAMNNILKNINQAKSVDIAVHRFTNREMISTIVKNAPNKEIRFLADDDLYWSGKLQKRVAANTKAESANVDKLIKAGVKTSYLETNEKIWQLHHNKFIIFNFEKHSTLHTGAGNFTFSAFTKNYENFYYIKIPAVVEIFKKQYDKLFNQLGSKVSELPEKYVLPKN